MKKIFLFLNNNVKQIDIPVRFLLLQVAVVACTIVILSVNL
jgi:hypothetical protein